MKKFDRCACHSKLLYHKCCQPFHEGKAPENALQLMRSRYAAYALNLPLYIMDTTHPEYKDFKADRIQWKNELEAFSEATKFDGLRIFDFSEGEQVASVTFIAYLRQNNTDVSFSEKSGFEKQGGRWLYKSGEVTELS